MKTSDSPQSLLGEEGDNGSNSAADSQRISSGVTFEAGGATKLGESTTSIEHIEGSYLEVVSAAEGSERPPLHPSAPVRQSDRGAPLPSGTGKENVIHQSTPTRPPGILGHKSSRSDSKRKECEIECDEDAPLVKRRSSSADCIDAPDEPVVSAEGRRGMQSFVEVVSQPVKVRHEVYYVLRLCSGMY